MNGVYKLVEIDGIPTMKQSRDKVSYPGRKQIFRQFEGSQVRADRLGLVSESPVEGEMPLLQLVMQQGRRVTAPEPLEAIAQRTAASVGSLPEATRRLDNPTPLAVEISTELQQLTEKTKLSIANGS